MSTHSKGWEHKSISLDEWTTNQRSYERANVENQIMGLSHTSSPTPTTTSPASIPA